MVALGLVGSIVAGVERLGATTLLMFRATDGIYLAADSRVNVTSATDGKRAVRDDGCKVLNISPFIVGIAGVVAVREGKAGFDVAAEIGLVPAQHQRLVPFAEALRERLAPVALRMYQYVYANDRARFGQLIKDTASGFTVLIAGPGREGLDGVGVLFRPELLAGTKISLTTVPKRLGRGIGALVPAGITTHLERQPIPPTQRALLSNPVRELRRLVTMESKTDPASVGGAVDIAKVSASGAEWIARKKGCPAR